MIGSPIFFLDVVTRGELPYLRGHQDHKLIDKTVSSEYPAVTAPLSVTSGTGGLFVPEQTAAKWCKKCGRKVTESQIMECKKTSCPFSFRDSIRGEVEPENIRSKDSGKTA